MGLSLNNIYQRPYVRQENRNPIKKREDEEKSAATTHREQESGQNSKSKGLQYVEQKQPKYTPAYEQKFGIPAASAYGNVSINARPQTTQTTVTMQITATIQATAQTQTIPVPTNQAMPEKIQVLTLLKTADSFFL